MIIAVRFLLRAVRVQAMLLVGIFCLLFPDATLCGAQSSNIVRIDASRPYADPLPANYQGGTSSSASGRTITVNSRYLMRDGKPWLPVVGEFHFSRYPASRWEEELLKMKAAGVDVVAAYIIWIHHEEVEGQFDWTGQRNLRAFAQLCAKHGMYLEPRIGPWAHAEARNGGLPDWLLKKGPTRVNDPVYLRYVRAWYGQIGQQLKGLLWRDGGPVIGIQIENEYSRRGPGAGTEHILELKRLAIESGLDVPLYLVTGWDNAAVPDRAVIPVYGGYPDAPWDASAEKLPPPEVYAFRFQSRVASNMGAIGTAEKSGADASGPSLLPYFTAEIGGGIEDTYHRRPVIHPDDIAAMFPVMLGSGVNLYGTYMFQGGENPDGKLSTLQESQATGYPTDVPVKSYDFQAPLSEFGEERASLRKMKVLQYFLNDFGESLAPMTVHAPERVPSGPEDFSVLRSSVRSRDDSGFLFVNNYVRNYAMPARRGVQFEISLPGGTLRVPQRPVDIPSGSYFIWPFNFRQDGVIIRYSTAQLFTRIQDGDSNTLYFAAIPGVPVEFGLVPATVTSVKVSSGEVVRDSGATLIRDLQPGIDSFVEITAANGKRVRLVVLTQEQAENAWRLRFGGEHLLITAQDFFADRAAVPETIHLRSRGNPAFDFSITPPVAETPRATLPLVPAKSGERSARYTAEAKERTPTLKFSQVRPAGEAAPVELGPALSWRPHGVAEAPPESAWNNAALWSISIPENSLDGLSDLYLQVNYQGDVARLTAGGRLLTDNFYNGQPWRIGLERFLDTKIHSFELSVLPLRRDSPVYLELATRPDFGPKGQVDKVNDVRLVPEYELILGEGASAPARH